MRKLISSFAVVALITVAGAAAPVASFAQTTTISSSIQTQLDLIASLTAQIKALQAQISGLVQQQQAATASLVSTLSLGSQGDQVKVLQALLAADSSIYPEGLITGFYGNATAKAVKRFQAKHGIAQVGNVGPKTLKALQDALDENPIAIDNSTSTASSSENEHGDGHGRLCAIVPPGHLIAPGWLRKNGGVVPLIPTCQTLPPGIGDHEHNGTSTTPSSTVLSLSNIVTGVTSSSATISWNTNLWANSQVMYGLTNSYGANTTLDPTLVTSHSQTITGLAASTTYHFEVISINGAKVATSSDMTFTTAAATTADTTAPVISSVVPTVTTSTANIAWNTNEAADSEVFYGPTSAYGSNTSLNSTLVTTHGMPIVGLAANTTYHFQVRSADASNNVATSSDMTFTTTALDTTAPVITVGTSTVASTTATLSWTTNEAATGKVFYGTINPLSLTATSTLTANASTLGTSQNVQLTGLTASTTYYFVIQATDASSNVATTSQMSIITTQ